MFAFDQQMRELLHIPGVRSVRLVDWRNGRIVTGYGRPGDEDPSNTAALVQTLADGPLCTEQEIEDVIVTDREHHLLYAPLRGTVLCVQVRMVRDGGSLGFALRRLRTLAASAGASDSSDSGLPPRRGRGHPASAPQDPVTIDRPVLERVLTALRSLSTGRPRAGTVIA